MNYFVNFKFYKMYKMKKYLTIGICINLFFSALFASNLYAQSLTTVIGGEGLPEIEVNLDSIYKNKSKPSNNLRYAGQDKNKTIKLIWPKNINQIRENIQKAPIEKVYKKKLISKSIERKTIPKVSEKKQPIKKMEPIVIQKKSIISTDRIKTKKNKEKLTNNIIKEPNSIEKQNNKISSLKTESNLQEINKIQRIIFEPTQTRLNEKYRSKISKIASYSIKQNLRIQIRAYASTSGNKPTYARRVSLSRALAIRTELIQYGVNSTNIDVRALGEAKDGGLPDRVDVSIMP